jgi:hypothetical protein
MTRADRGADDDRSARNVARFAALDMHGGHSVLIGEDDGLDPVAQPELAEEV